ncbi:MAG: MerR family transcriptional regulator [Candidatus Omnitrophica bacterium]|nr:MerR family transcriptional regulator [Candidatus Omnitrophota bacterium]
MKKKYIFAQEIIKKFNISYQTLNYYTAMGLLPVTKRIGNKRVYEEEMIIQRLQRISRLAKEGYPLNLIRKKIVGI